MEGVVKGEERVDIPCVLFIRFEVNGDDGSWCDGATGEDETIFRFGSGSYAFDGPGSHAVDFNIECCDVGSFRSDFLIELDLLSCDFKNGDGCFGVFVGCEEIGWAEEFVIGESE